MELLEKITREYFDLADKYSKLQKDYEKLQKDYEDLQESYNFVSYDYVSLLRDYDNLIKFVGKTISKKELGGRDYYYSIHLSSCYFAHEKGFDVIETIYSDYNKLEKGGEK